MEGAHLMFCIQCEAILPNDARYCLQCGKAVPLVAPKHEAEKTFSWTDPDSGWIGIGWFVRWVIYGKGKFVLVGLVTAIALSVMLFEPWEPKVAHPAPPKPSAIRLERADPTRSTPAPPARAVVPYASLELRPVSNSAFLNLSGWGMARGIHQKYGFSSDQKALFSYKKVLGRSQEEITLYLGQLEGKDGQDFIYRTASQCFNLYFFRPRRRLLQGDVTDGRTSSQHISCGCVVEYLVPIGGTLARIATSGGRFLIEWPQNLNGSV